MADPGQVTHGGRRGIAKLVGAIFALAAVGGGVAFYLNSSYWSAQRIGDVALDGFSYGELRQRLGARPQVRIPKASSKVEFRLEPNISISFSGLPPDLQQTADALRRMESRMFEPLVLGESLDQAEVTFGRGIVRAGFHVGFEDSALMNDRQTAVWVRVVPPFRGSIYGIHLGDPCGQAESRLAKLGARDVEGPLLGGELVSIRNVGLHDVSDWLAQVGCEAGGGGRVSQVTTWRTGFRTVKVATR